MAIDKPEILRLFYALWPDESTRTALTRLQASLAGRMMHRQDLHITLAFLGQQPATLLPLLHAILRQLPQPDVRLQLDRIGYFPRSRIVWAGMDSVPDALSELHDELGLRLAENGIRSVQHGSFTPHVTLARDAPAPTMSPLDPVQWHANRMVLVQSVNATQAERYRVL
jgi:2'-5' RNA ligase